MEQYNRHPLRDNHERKQPIRQDIPQPANTVDGTVMTHPIDGSQYIDVIEEQEYADRRPSAEEQQPRFSYLHKENAEPDDEQDG